MQLFRTLFEQLFRGTLPGLGFRFAFSLILSLIFISLFFTLDGANNKTIKKNKDLSLYFLHKRTVPWVYYATVVGYFALTCPGLEEGGAATLPMLVCSMEKSVWLDMLSCVAFPLLPAMIWLFITFRSMKLRAWPYVLFGICMGLSFGMLFGQLCELVMRLVSWVSPYIGFGGHILFYAMILLQIGCLCWQLLSAAGLFIMSFFHDDTLAEMRAKRELTRLRSSGKLKGGDGGGGGSSGSSGSSHASHSSTQTQFPDSLMVNGQLCRLAHSSSDTATYYNPKTGVRTTIRNTDLPGYD